MSTFQFPKDLKLNIQPYIIFNSFKWSMRGKKTQDITSVKKSEDSIILPISTNGIIDSVNNNWESGAGLGASSFGQAFLKDVLTKVTDAAGDLGKYISVRKGALVNDYASLAFTGTEFRQFDFNFTMIPKNSQESTVIIDICKAFKRNSLPSYEGWKITYPNCWNILIKFPGSQDIIKIKNCVMNNFTTSIFSDGTPTINTNGTPQKTDISMSFTELQKLDRRDYI